jgi:hypothetical protein
MQGVFEAKDASDVRGMNWCVYMQPTMAICLFYNGQEPTDVREPN